MNKKIKQLLVGFKPQIGNLNHIRAMEIIAKINKRDALKKKKLQMNNQYQREIREIDAELTDEEKQLAYLLK
jgi:hypothetical protein